MHILLDRSEKYSKTASFRNVTMQETWREKKRDFYIYNAPNHHPSNEERMYKSGRGIYIYIYSNTKKKNENTCIERKCYKSIPSRSNKQ
jgi:hypothetical protein